jgi:hypothetical protein
MSRLLWVIPLVLVLCAGVSHAYSSHVIARAVVYPNSQNSVLAAGAGAAATDSCYAVNLSGFSSVLPLVWHAYAGVAPYYTNGGGMGAVLSFPVDIPMRYAFSFNKLKLSTSYSGFDCFGIPVNVTQYPYSWNRYANGTAWSAGVVNFGVLNATASPVWDFDFNTSDISSMTTFYNNTGDMFLSVFGIPNPPSSPTVCGSGIACSSVSYYGLQFFGLDSPNLTITLKDFSFGSFIDALLPNGGNVFINLHSFLSTPSGSGSEYHVQWKNNDMNLTAINGIPMFWSLQPKVIVNGTSSPSSFCPDPDAVPYAYPNSFIVDAGQLPTQDYIACLDLRGYNGGRKFIGVVDIWDASAAGLFTNGKLYADVALLSPKDKFFYNVSYSPIVPSTLANFTVSADFGYAMYGTLHYQRTIVNATQPWQSITDGASAIHHSFTIPQSELNYTNVTIELYMEASEGLVSPRVLIQQPTTSVFATNITPVYPGIPTVITPYDDIRNRIGAGANFIIDTAPCPLCVPPQLHTSIGAWCSVDSLTERSTHYYDITPINSTSPSSAHVSTWTLAEINGTGIHNVTCRPTVSNEFLFQPNTTSVNVTGDPFYALVVLPNIPSCDGLVLENSRAGCEAEMLNRTPGHYAAWYCRERGPPNYPSSYCGYWEGNGCPNASLVPSGYAVNGSTANINCIVPPAGNFSQPPANFTVPPFLSNNTNLTGIIYNILGMTPYIFLNFISLIMSVVLAILVAVKSKSGLATGVVFIGGIFIFAVVGWLPIWILIVLGVLTAFLVARFASETIFGGGK